ncbi:MAG: hypothetical protein HUJ68_08230, partial [Clostridia bacterium]|nr:hypothetical protein [Clostridia bacterium]
MEDKKYWIWLSQIEGLGAKRKQELLEIFKKPENIYYLKRYELLKIKGIGETLANNILDKKIRGDLQKHIEYMIKNNIDIISIYDKEYPKILKKIYDYPISFPKNIEVEKINEGPTEKQIETQ